MALYVESGYVESGYVEGGSDSYITIPTQNLDINVNTAVAKNIITIYIPTQNLDMLVNKSIISISKKIQLLLQSLNIDIIKPYVFDINPNLQTIICKIDNIDIKAVLDNEFPIPKIDINQDITNTGFLDYSNLFSNEFSNSLILDWTDYKTVEKIKNLDYNIKHSLYRCNGVFLFDINIISIEVEEIYRGALWYNVKINYKRMTDG